MNACASPIPRTGQTVRLEHLSAGTLRDSCVCSIIAGEWPTVKAHLGHTLRRTSIKDVMPC